MEKKDFVLALQISRNFDSRSAEDTKKLYKIIQSAAKIAQDTSNKNSDAALQFLVELYNPLIKKVATRLFLGLGYFTEYIDILQEAYVIFIQLLEKYDASVASFSYYVGVMLPQRMNRWAEKEYAYMANNVITDTKEFPIIDPITGDTDSVSNYLDSYVVMQEYSDFIKKRAERISRSDTVRVVCYDYFLGSRTCSQISQSLGISYHAVYEIIGKIKKELKVFFNESHFSGYWFSSTGVTQRKVH